MKKIVFVAHEFGLFAGRGGIAAYLYHLAKGFIESVRDVEIYILCIKGDSECDLTGNDNFHLYNMHGAGLRNIGLEILKRLKLIRPDIVEVADAFGLCLEALVYKQFSGKEFSATKFFVINHTSIKDCIEWSYQIPLELAQPNDIYTSYREKAQMFLAECNIYPCNFLRNYCKKNYSVKNTKILRYTYCDAPVEKNQLSEKVSKEIDFSPYSGAFIVTYISRFEGRKNQRLLVKEFICFLEETQSDAILFLVGNSVPDVISGLDTRDEIFAEIPEKYRKNIHFFDFADREKLEQFCIITDLVVMTSFYENFPFAMMDNGFRKVPVMTSIYNGYSDVMGIYKDEMTFNPFVHGDVCQKIIGFYNSTEQERSRISDEQYQNLNDMCCVKNSITSKLDFYIGFQKIRDNLDRKLVFLSGKDLTHVYKRNNVGEIDVVLAPLNYHPVVKLCIEKYKDVINDMDENSVIIFHVGEIQDVNIEQSLQGLRSIYVKNVSVGENEMMYKVLAEQLSKKNPVMALPIPEAVIKEFARHDVSFDLPFTPLIAQMRRIKNDIHIEGKI